MKSTRRFRIFRIVVMLTGLGFVLIVCGCRNYHGNPIDILDLLLQVADSAPVETGYGHKAAISESSVVPGFNLGAINSEFVEDNIEDEYNVGELIAQKTVENGE